MARARGPRLLGPEWHLARVLVRAVVTRARGVGVGRRPLRPSHEVMKRAEVLLRQPDDLAALFRRQGPTVAGDAAPETLTAIVYFPEGSPAFAATVESGFVGHVETQSTRNPAAEAGSLSAWTLIPAARGATHRPRFNRRNYEAVPSKKPDRSRSAGLLSASWGELISSGPGTHRHLFNPGLDQAFPGLGFGPVTVRSYRW